MTRASFEEVASENFDLREVTRELMKHFGNEVPGGSAVEIRPFVEQFVAGIDVHVHTEHDELPPPTSWTNNLGFIVLIDLSEGAVDKITCRVCDKKKDLLAVFKNAIKEAPVGSSLHFQNVFTVRRAEMGTYSIGIHTYPRTFFHRIILDDPEIIGFVVHNQLKINGAQLELPPKVLTGDFSD